MEQNRFFKWLWRINAIGLFFLLGAGLFSFMETQMRDRNYDVRADPITSVAEDPRGVEKWVLGRGREVEGSDYTMVSLVSEYSKVKALDKMSYAPTNNVHMYNGNLAKNILFVDTKDNSSSWLFPTNNQLIVEYATLINGLQRPYVVHENNNLKAKFIYYKIIDKDTTGDKIANINDKQSFAVSDVSGKNYKVILSTIERIISMNTINEKELHLIYQKDGVGYSLMFDIDKFETISDVVLPKVGES